MNRVGDPLATHEINKEKGKLVKLASHRRNRRGRAEELLNKTVALLGEEFREYLSILCQTKPRYVREQLGLVVKACETYGRERMMAAIRYCQEMTLYSAVDLNDAATVMGEQESPPTPPRLPVADERYHVSVQKRELSVYAEVAEEGGSNR